MRRWMRSLRMEQPFVPQRALQIRLHLHGAELLDGEVQVRKCFLSLLRGRGWSEGLIQEQLRELEAAERDLRPETDPLAGFEPLQVIATCLLWMVKEPG